MALIQCYECSKEVSDEALACPQCGAPKVMSLQETLESVAVENEPEHTDYFRKTPSGRWVTPSGEPVWGESAKEPLSAGFKVALSFGAVLLWVAVVRTLLTGAPDNPMGLLDVFPLVFIWWLWSAKGPRVSARTSSPKPHSPTTTRKSPRRHPQGDLLGIGVTGGNKPGHLFPYFFIGFILLALLWGIIGG